MKKHVLNFIREENGATMIEYGIMVALIAVICVAIIGTVGTNLLGTFTTISTSF